MFYKARETQFKAHGKTDVAQLKGLNPSWIHGDIWNKLVETWSTEEWRCRSQSARKNRNIEKHGAIVKHTGGSISFAEHDRRLV